MLPAVKAVIGHAFAGSCLSCAGQAQGNHARYTFPQVTQPCGRAINRPTTVGIAPS